MGIVAEIFKRQDLKKMAIHFRAGALELQNTGQDEHSLILTMLKAYLMAGGTGNKDYCYSLRGGLKSRLDDELLAIRYMHG